MVETSPEEQKNKITEVEENDASSGSSSSSGDSGSSSGTDSSSEQSVVPDPIKNSKQERLRNQKVIKGIEVGIGPENFADVPKSKVNRCQERFRMLQMYNEERQKLHHQFQLEIKEHVERFRKKRDPYLLRRDKVIDGETTKFEDWTGKFDTQAAAIEQKKNLEKIMEKNMEKNMQRNQEAAAQNNEEEKQPEVNSQAEEVQVNPVSSRQALDLDHLIDVEGIPDFWSQAIKNHVMLQQVITYKDEPILEHLVKLEVRSNLEVKYSVTMKFKPNEFFTNENLSFQVLTDPETEQTIEIIGTEIEWKSEDLNPTRTVKKRTKLDPKTGEKTVVSKSKPCSSFFSAFQSHKMPAALRDQVDLDDLEHLDTDDDKIL